MEEPKITWDELQTELDKYRGASCQRIKLTDDQIEFMKKCRIHKDPVPYSKMAELWAQLGWGNMSKSSIQIRWKKIENENL